MLSKERHAVAYLACDFRPEDWLCFIQSHPFARKWVQHGLTDEDLRALEVVIMAKPSGPPVMKHTGGLRKIRFAKESQNRGKSASFRVCYVYFEEYAKVFLVTLFGKTEKSNLTTGERNQIASVIAEIEQDLAQGRV